MAKHKITCIVCNTVMKKKDSVLFTIPVCSIACKEIRKSTLPKKLSCTSFQYWINQGLSEYDAKLKVSLMQKSRSPRSTHYWIKKGFSELDANLKVSEHQSASSLCNLKNSKEERAKKSAFSPHYWINKGYTYTESKEILSKRSDTASINYFISKYGETDGTRVYNEKCDYRKKNYTLAGFIKRHGVDQGTILWNKKFKCRYNSKKATEFFDKLSILFTGYKIYTAGNENGEYGVLNTTLNKYYYYDFVIPELLLCVEYHGNYWHCNPLLYESTFLHPQSNLPASEIWKNDQIKQEYLLSARGITTIVVWESDDVLKSINKIQEIKNDFTKNKN